MVDKQEEEARCTVHRGEPGETNEGRAREERRQRDIISFLPFSDTNFNPGLYNQTSEEERRKSAEPTPGGSTVSSGTALPAVGEEDLGYDVMRNKQGRRRGRG